MTYATVTAIIPTTKHINNFRRIVGRSWTSGEKGKIYFAGVNKISSRLISPDFKLRGPSVLFS